MIAYFLTGKFGDSVWEPTVEEMRAHRQADIKRLDPGVRRLMNPHIYHVSLTERLWQQKQNLVRQALGQTGKLVGKTQR